MTNKANDYRDRYVAAEMDKFYAVFKKDKKMSSSHVADGLLGLPDADHWLLQDTDGNWQYSELNIHSNPSLAMPLYTATQMYDYARAALTDSGMQWRPIESAPRDGTRVLVACHSDFSGWHVTEAWWAIPYEAAPPERGWWSYDGNRTMLDASIHVDKAGKGLGASHWQPIPTPPPSKEKGNG